MSWLDFKLGFRMLARYPGLTIVGGIAMAFGVAVGAAAFEFISQILHPKLSLDEGNRVVALSLWDAAASRTEQRTLHDLARWRAQLRTVEQVGAFRTLDRNLITENGARGEPVIGAEISASAFPLARVKPLLGRTLVADDERPDAPAVVVIGYDIWQSRFASDPHIVGRTIRLGSTPTTVVGVMPDGFAFPAFHSVWTPLRLDPADYPEGEGPPLTRVFARLRDGVSLDQAQAELSALGVRRTGVSSETRVRLRPQVTTYAASFLTVSGAESAAIASVNVFLALLMALVCGNVALLVFARAATRESEIVVRTALGASRARIVTQLFAEALVLGGVALVAGLVAANIGLQRGMAILVSEEHGRIPFWISHRITPSAVLYAIGLTILGAVIAGVLPALKVTRGLDGRLRQAAAGVSGAQFGGVWTAIIVAQIAITVLFPVTAFLARRDAVQVESLDLGLPAREYLTAQVGMDRETAPRGGVDTSTSGYLARYRAISLELERRIEEQPGVSGVAFASLLPGMDHPQSRIDVDGGGAAPVDSTRGYHASSAYVSPNYFDVAGARIVAGRGFTAADVSPGRRVVVVNQSFVRDVFGPRNAIGRRVRYARGERERGASDEPWYEIIGVVRDLAMTDGTDPHETGAGMYHADLPGAVLPRSAQPTPSVVAGRRGGWLMAIHVKGDARTFGPTLGAIATALDPALRLDRVVPLSELQDANLRWMAFWFRTLVGVSGVALLLSLAAIYAVMAFAVSRRTREIGIRVALGADRRGIVSAIFTRPLKQVAIGIATGGVLVGVFVFLVFEEMSVRQGAFIALYAAAMMLVCLLACVVPTRRALAIEPTDALRADS